MAAGRTILLVVFVSAAIGCSPPTAMGANDGGSCVVAGISLDQPDMTLNVGGTLPVTAAQRCVDGSSLPINDLSSITWAVSDEHIVGVTIQDSATAQLTALSPGQAIVTASYRSFTAWLTITVPPIVEQLVVSPADGWIPEGFSVGLTATAVYSNGQRVDVTSMAAWTLDDPTLGAIVDGSPAYAVYDPGAPLVADSSFVGPGTAAMFQASTTGRETIAATFESHTASAAVTIMPLHIDGVLGRPYPSPSDNVNNAFVSSSLIAVDGAGTASSVWSYTTGEIFTSSTKAGGTSWLPNVEIRGRQSQFQRGVSRLFAGEAGERLFVFLDGNVMSATYAPAQQPFGPIQSIPAPAGVPSFYNVTISNGFIDASGNATIGWVCCGGAYLSRYDASNGVWTLPTVVSTNAFVAAFNANAGAVVIFGDFSVSTTMPTINAVVYTPGSALPSPQPLTDDMTAFDFSASINDSGDAVVAWTGRASPPPALPAVAPVVPMSATYSRSSGWTSAAPLPLPNGIRDTSGLRTAIDASGNAFAAWVEPAQLSVYASRFTPAAGWGMPELFTLKAGAGTPRVDALVVDDAGNAICFYQDGQPTPQRYIYRRYLVGQGWTPSSALQDSARIGRTQGGLSVSYNHHGDGVVSWEEDANLYVPGATPQYPTAYHFTELAPAIVP
jgi:hypothetical protein